MSSNNILSNSPDFLKVVTLPKGFRLMSCSAGLHTFDKYTTAPLWWFQSSKFKLSNNDINSNRNLTTKNSWFCQADDPNNVFYFYEAKRDLKLLKDTDYYEAIQEYLYNRYPNVYNKIPYENIKSVPQSKSRQNTNEYPDDYISAMLLSKIFSRNFDGLYLHDGEIILWPSYTKKLTFIRKSFNKSNPLTKWNKPTSGPGTFYYEPSNEVISDVRNIFKPIFDKQKRKPFIKPINGGKRYTYKKQLYRKLTRKHKI